MRRPLHQGTAAQAGFTIIELMIATLIFSLVLILITTGVMQFTRQYYKGLISSKTQNTARSIIDDVGRAIQFNTGIIYKLTDDPAPLKAAGYCVGETRRYSFVLNAQVVDDAPDTARHQSGHALISDVVSGCSTATPALDPKNPNVLTSLDPQTNNKLINARELLGQKMRLSKFVIEEVSGMANTYTITVRVIYGDDELLCSPSIEGACNDRNTVKDELDNADELMCKSTVGNQFCAVSELTTTVKKRVN
ncbi:MAG TPA: prepilin-type N-terminal cleavage/methylation domain-containing protein [Candidatus Saccharimonadales bacterium]|nr:prepilin-type N-terminal cleavage/methylation domain-containing protein [Candidatus Saccharimonadales bacterium]